MVSVDSGKIDFHRRDKVMPINPNHVHNYVPDMPHNPLDTGSRRNRSTALSSVPGAAGALCPSRKHSAGPFESKT